MSKALIYDGLVLIKVWAIGFFGGNINGIIHLLPAIAILVLLTWFFFRKSFIPKPRFGLH
jgi:hypothetical protein